MEEDGTVVLLQPGQKVPAHLADLLTNPSAFVVVDEAASPAPAPTGDTTAPTLSLRDLQRAAKARGLSGAGNAATLADRIEAHDRQVDAQ